MYPDSVGIVLLGVILVWLINLTYLVLKDRGLRRVFVKPPNLENKFGEILAGLGALEEFKKKSLGCIQKVALKRYNPYKDTGGDQSFSVALLDGRGDGVVITSLHSRAATRIFAKTVRSGTGEIALSAEEKEIIKKALST